ncbi:MAG: hypothetical protein L0Z07_10320, partial [Planctomycetes bacterium]|nr:hypothetical protein [Planctomycetota bacterium]
MILAIPIGASENGFPKLCGWQRFRFQREWIHGDSCCLCLLYFPDSYSSVVGGLSVVSSVDLRCSG